MNTALLMRASSIIMGVVGVAAIFAPEEVIAQIGGPAGVFNKLLIEIAGALYFGFALMNWMAQGNLIGGVYSRPVAMGNFAHFFVAGMALIKIVFAGEHSIPALAGAAVYTVFAVLFAVVVFGNPQQSQ